MPSTQTRNHGVPTPPQLPGSGEEIYNMIMASIEPELVSGQIPQLKEKYKNETPEQKKERGERYKKAFAEYDKRYDQYMLGMGAKMKAYHRGMRGAAEGGARRGEQKTMDGIEQQIFHKN